MARFFIDRPVFAWVIAIIIMLAGGISITQLPISRYPTIAPPTVTINATYPGASAKSVEDSVTQVIEQNMKALDGMVYLSSTSESNGVVVRRSADARTALAASITDRHGMPNVNTVVRDTAKPEFAITALASEKNLVLRVPPERLFGLPE